MLEQRYSPNKTEAGCDEAGRGCLAGPVVAAAVVLPDGYCNPLLNDSKKLSALQRLKLKREIENDAVSWAVAEVSNEEIDRTNILRASFHAMCLAVQQLSLRPELLLIDGNRFENETGIDYVCIVKGDARFQSIAAASILAKTYRDAYMQKAHRIYPLYGWSHNMGYPTSEHYSAIEQHGITPLHRKSYRLNRQLSIDFDAEPTSPTSSNITHTT